MTRDLTVVSAYTPMLAHSGKAKTKLSEIVNNFRISIVLSKIVLWMLLRTQMCMGCAFEANLVRTSTNKYKQCFMRAREHNIY